MEQKTVVGIGNALTDLLIPTTDSVLESIGLPKGSMQLIDAGRARSLRERVCPEGLCAGGSAANTTTGLGSLGVRAAFVGKVGRDPTGDAFEVDLQSHGVTSRLIRSDTPSGTAFAFVTPDGERTFATHLGAAVELAADDLTDAHFADADFVHIEGYLVQNHTLLAAAVARARERGAVCSIDLASYNVVSENLAFLRSLAGLDIIFANEHEAEAFTGLSEEAAAQEIARRSRIAVVKLGARGSLVASGESLFRIAAEPVRVVDTSGAGDLYAAGFLFGLVHGCDLVRSGHIGACMAREVIQIAGSKLPEAAWERIRNYIASS